MTDRTRSTQRDKQQTPTRSRQHARRYFPNHRTGRQTQTKHCMVNAVRSPPPAATARHASKRSGTAGQQDPAGSLVHQKHAGNLIATRRTEGNRGSIGCVWVVRHRNWADSSELHSSPGPYAKNAKHGESWQSWEASHRRSRMRRFGLEPAQFADRTPVAFRLAGLA